MRTSIFSLALVCLGCPSSPAFEDDDGGTESPPARCGNGVLEDGEFCDAGGANNDIVPNACRSDCTLPSCGDGVRDDTEECDLGEQNGGPECTQDCVSLVDDTSTSAPQTGSTTIADTETDTDASTTMVDPSTSSGSSETSSGDGTAGSTTTMDAGD